MNAQQRIEGIKVKIKDFESKRDSAQGALGESNERIQNLIETVDKNPIFTETQKTSLKSHLYDLKDAKSSAEIKELEPNDPTKAWIDEIDTEIESICKEAEDLLNTI